MLASAVASTFDYMGVAIEDDGSNRKEIRDGEYKKLVTAFTTVQSSREDVTRCLTMLKGETPFSPEQAKELRKQLATLQSSSAPSFGGPETPSRKTHIATKTQDCTTFEEYWTQR